MARVLIVAILLSLAICWAVSGGIVAPSAAGVGEVVWQPSKCEQGGPQYDPRLDRPVSFWRAAVPLREVLGELTRQTGVAFDFAASDADEPRLCVTLYLNCEQPPALRAVMAQLMWVTGCSFSYSQAPGGERTYHLLWSSVGHGAAERLAAEAAARRDEFLAEWEVQRSAQRERAVRALREERAALALSQAEAIARYRGVNDALLLNLVDPARRAGLDFLTSLSEDDTNALLGDQRRMPVLSREWSAWSPEQQSALKQALGLEDLPKDSQVQVVVDSGRDGLLMALVRTDQGPQVLGTMWGLLASGRLRRGQEAQLRSLLGESQVAEETGAGGEQAAARPDRDSRREQWDRWREQWVEERAQAMAEARALSPEVEQLLAGVTLPGATADGALWQVQEAVAKATGLNVVADCFSAPRFRFGPPGEAAAEAMDALEALSEASTAFVPGFGGGPRGRGGRRQPGPGAEPGGDDLGQQWGDAGAFLRFRAQRPDIWRAAVLPADVLAQLDAWLKPFVDTAEESPGPGSSPLAAEVEKTSWLASRLTDLQIQLGGAIPYEDPADAAAARLQALRRQTLQQIGFGLPISRLLASLTPKQWARLKGDGLQWGTDLTPDQQSSDVSSMLAFGVPEERVADVVIRLGQTEERTVQWPGGSRTLPAAPALSFLLDGAVVNQIPLSWGWGFGQGRGGRPGWPGGGRGARGLPGGRGRAGG